MTAMFDDEDQQKRYEQFQRRRDKYFGRDAQQEMPTIVYKRFDNALRPEPQRAAEMDAETAAKWNEWCDGRIAPYVDMIAEVVGSETGIMHRELNAEIAKLRAEVEMLRTKVNGGAT
jgi:hypothetical protein